MQCISCGTTLPPETAICYYCGAATSYNVSSSNDPAGYDTPTVADGPFIETSSAATNPHAARPHPFMEKTPGKESTNYGALAVQPPLNIPAPQPLYAAPQGPPEQWPPQQIPMPEQRHPGRRSGLSRAMTISLIIAARLNQRLRPYFLCRRTTPGATARTGHRDRRNATDNGRACHRPG